MVWSPKRYGLIVVNDRMEWSLPDRVPELTRKSTLKSFTSRGSSQPPSLPDVGVFPGVHSPGIDVSADAFDYRRSKTQPIDADQSYERSASRASSNQSERSLDMTSNHEALYDITGRNGCSCGRTFTTPFRLYEHLYRDKSRPPSVSTPPLPRRSSRRLPLAIDEPTLHFSSSPIVRKKPSALALPPQRLANTRLNPVNYDDERDDALGAADFVEQLLSPIRVESSVDNSDTYSDKPNQVDTDTEHDTYTDHQLDASRGSTPIPKNRPVTPDAEPLNENVITADNDLPHIPGAFPTSAAPPPAQTSPAPSSPPRRHHHRRHSSAVSRMSVMSALAQEKRPVSEAVARLFPDDEEYGGFVPDSRSAQNTTPSGSINAEMFSDLKQSRPLSKPLQSPRSPTNFSIPRIIINTDHSSTAASGLPTPTTHRSFAPPSRPPPPLPVQSITPFHHRSRTLGDVLALNWNAKSHQSTRRDCPSADSTRPSSIATDILFDGPLVF